MSIGGSSKGGGAQGGFDVTGGGANAPWSWGVSPFDQSAIDTATGQNATSITDRYNQLGLGGSTPEGQDLGSTPSLTGGNTAQGQALTGEEQTANVGNPALNPALQQQFNQQIGTNAGAGITGLTSLAGLAGKALTAGAAFGA
jgi:hypothetical protein